MALADDTIIGFEFAEVVVPTNPGVINSEGLDKPLHMLPVGGKAAWSVQFDELPKLILHLKLAGGVVGLGEFYRDHEWPRVEAIVNGLMGLRLSELTLQDLPLPLCREYDGFECAIWDAYAKLLGVPMHKLLGGAIRDRVRVGAWSSHRRVEEVGPLAAAFQEQGFDCIKFKCDLDDDPVAWCREIASHAPGMKVILDPNQRWENSSSARPIIKALEEVGNILALEDPIPRWMLQEYADLRQFSSLSIALHVSLPYVYQGQRPYDAINALTHRAVDGFNFNGGLARFKELDAIARTANLSCWHGSEVDLGILEAMYVHQSAAARSCIWPGDIFGRLIRSHDLLKEPLTIKAPYAFIPEGPGLGIELDEDAIERFKVGERAFS
ncbi:mandelate racemase [Rhodobacteraceae bacterium RKSG542]|uniref:mandelate racemase/muconate lactonizing enzyme family protein n=1 Tax=Pseudovibrio flavus TaxID=2529854 RepID=UPI0012BCCE1D|nr:mandelate racemase/muconate lactonizing enzyme family protein [Pseudovibrio flavus]MTI16456.1 mandelate racemase [Pseudovibrio flavus]